MLEPHLSPLPLRPQPTPRPRSTPPPSPPMASQTSPWSQSNTAPDLRSPGDATRLQHDTATCATRATTTLSTAPTIFVRVATSPRQVTASGIARSTCPDICPSRSQSRSHQHPPPSRHPQLTRNSPPTPRRSQP
ncbi:hypothetical protein M0805_007521 [Coniferiporia weirii]|nr:hypothetical protein M0805_007521 [Coniferiporia weirii]